MNVKISLLCICLLSAAFAVPVHRAARSASDSSSTESLQKSISLSSESDESDEVQTLPTTTEDSDSDDDDDDDDDLMTAVPTDAPVTEPFTPAPFTRGDNTGRGDSVAYELRAAPRKYKPLAQVALDTADDDASTPDMESQQQFDDLFGLTQAVGPADKEMTDSSSANDALKPDSSSHQDITVSAESNSLEDHNKAQPDVSVENDSHPNEHASNESNEATAIPSINDSNEATENQEKSLEHNSDESKEAII